MNSIALKPGVFICHDGGGFYAMNSHCTHAGFDMQTYPNSVFNVNNLNGGFLCGHAQSRFNYEGTVTAGPATQPLFHFRLTVDANLHLHVDQTPPFPDVTCRCPG